ncbi:unnamed protein product [Fraxinus pennsylvanica]|uniref:DNA recombination-mediator protein A n=1 Tax=Fraxinus pennsylvanica TaxID=56036 RepID=A0AAD2E150_9LAMI|nr:unnamed protein product [Fraxinus pennsylvanica]
MGLKSLNFYNSEMYICLELRLATYGESWRNLASILGWVIPLNCLLLESERALRALSLESWIISSGTTPTARRRNDYNLDLALQLELLAIQQEGPRAIGFFGTRNMAFMHQELIEILSYALVITKNHIFTSGASGTNAAVIRGALRAEKPELLTVILPQSLKKQPPESQELLSKVKNVIEKPHNDHLPLIEASRLCNMDIISQVQQVICFAFHDSRLLMETCQEAKNMRKIVTLFYLD